MMHSVGTRPSLWVAGRQGEPHLEGLGFWFLSSLSRGLLVRGRISKCGMLLGRERLQVDEPPRRFGSDELGRQRTSTRFGRILVVNDPTWFGKRAAASANGDFRAGRPRPGGGSEII